MRSEGAFLLGWLGTLYTGGRVSEGGYQMQTGQVQTVGDIVDVETRILVKTTHDRLSNSVIECCGALDVHVLVTVIDSYIKIW